MQILFLNHGKRGRAMIADVLETMETYYKVKIISCESKKDFREEGKNHMVRKDMATVIE